MGNSTRIGSGNTYGTVIAYTCPHGYYIGRSSESTYTGTRDVTATVHCQADKTWSAEPDDCLSSCKNSSLNNVVFCVSLLTTVLNSVFFNSIITTHVHKNLSRGGKVYEHQSLNYEYNVLSHICTVITSKSM